MSKVTKMGSLPMNAVVLDSFVGFALQAMVVETAIVATKSVSWLLMMMGTLPNGIDVFIKEPEAYAGFPLARLLAVSKPGPGNKDACDTEDDDDDEEDEAADDQDEDGGEEEDGSGEEGKNEGDPEDEPEANGDGGSGEEDDDDDDDDNDDDDDGEEEEEEEGEEEEEEELQPPTKKRK
ncbi:glutamic acid-rich protein-like [Durio zibethinus]|uniref:Glutamic acid-rich protein-like n=1 Tax=Durio zibethinus TaxID=66656 RepID=A0A6P5ZQ22_DURZI|nr:glutamic acid-rich protein-like [Durio zibethinus]